MDRFLPTVETMKQIFDGIPYEDLPIVHIKASKNNTIITVTDAKVNSLIIANYRFLIYCESYTGCSIIICHLCVQFEHGAGDL